MSNRRGRPKSSEPIRDVQYRLRITPEEHEFLKEVSENTGLSMSQLIRAGVLGYREDILKQNLFQRKDRHRDYDRMKEVLRCFSDKNHDNSDGNASDVE